MAVELLKHLPSLLWFGLALVVLLVFYRRLRSLLELVEWRLKAGAPIKLSAFELGAVQVHPGKKAPANTERVRRDEDGRFHALRQELRDVSVFIVHRLTPSSERGMLYDVVIYAVPGLRHGTLLNVNFIEYYFGKYWNGNIYQSVDRSSGFSISTSAYAPFTCTACINYNDGTQKVVHRFIDFEMGNIGGARPSDATTSKRDGKDVG